MALLSRAPLWLVADLSKPPGTGDKAREKKAVASPAVVVDPQPELVPPRRRT